MSEELVLFETNDGVTTLTLNNPRRLNGWTAEMMLATRAAFDRAASDKNTLVVILTGTGKYYCAGVNLGGVLKLAHPKTLHAMIVEHNQAWFDLFLDFPKPIIVAANGPAIGAAVTSATLCDAIIAAESATFSTPFYKLGVPAEGCSSEYFPRLIGKENQDRMMGKEAWQPTGLEAAEIGLVDAVVPNDELLFAATKLARTWVDGGRGRTFRDGATRDELKAVNAKESIEIADAFLGSVFLKNQYKFLRSKKKNGPALMFFGLLVTRPVWSKLLP